VVEPLKYAHEASTIKAEEMGKMLEELVKVYPGLEQELRRNLEQYGTFVLAGSKGARWAEDLPLVLTP